MPVLFSITLFTSATLLFMVQPMVGKMVLPLLGGSPAAWNTCMVFFQGLLLLGYLYADRLTAKLAPAPQANWHVVVLAGVGGWFALAAALAPSGAPVPIFKTLAPQGEAYPMFGVLALLGAAIGLPFLIVSTSAPLLQRWFAYTGHPSSKDPYFLYATSNAGSLISLLGYPLFIEPTFSLVQQAWIFAGGFVLLAVLVYFCGEAVKRSPGANTPPPRPTADTTPDPHAPTWARKVKWMALAFVPSSLMLGVTFHMTTDIASVPLLWVIPLALYLVTFIIAFAHTPPWVRPLLGNVSPVVTLLLIFVLISGVGSSRNFSTFSQLALHLATYFLAALMLHSELARDRPDPKYLTGFYLWISLGGVLGGMFNALIAPVAFTQPHEYPIAIAIGCLLVPNLRDPKEVADEWAAMTDTQKLVSRGFTALIPVAMVAFVGWMTLLPDKFPETFGGAVGWVAGVITGGFDLVGSKVKVGSETISILAIYALPCILCFLFIDKPVRFGLCVGAVLFVNAFRSERVSALAASERSFFGILKVDGYTAKTGERRLIAFARPNAVPGAEEEEPPHPVLVRYGYRKLSHGTTLHGMQAADRHTLTQFATEPTFWRGLNRSAKVEWMAEAVMRDDVRLFGASNPWDAVLLAGVQTGWDFRQEPLTYYHRTGPVGEIVREFRTRNPKADIGMVGLGTGSIACYALPGQSLTFYEIDPTVLKLVEGDEHFTFVSDARKRGANVNFVLGDARLKLEEQKDTKYGLLLIDAFSSDSIPIHLLTKEAVQLYTDRLAPGGLLAIHISNRYVMLEPVCAILAKELGLACRISSDTVHDDPSWINPYPGKTSSSWVVMARSEEDLGGLGIEDPKGGGGLAALTGMAAWFDFRPWERIKIDKNVPAWTDDYSDVLRVMRLGEIRWVRRQFGLPVANEESED